MSSSMEKKFVIKHVFTDVNNLQVGRWYEKEEQHFNMKWYTYFIRGTDAFYLRSRSERDGFDREWTIDATIDAKIRTITGEEVVVKNFKFSNELDSSVYFKSNEKIHNYIVDKNFSVEFHVTINEMTGIEEIPEKKISRSFDKSTKEFSDVVLMVKDQKFYVNKMYLASHSPYFNALLLGNFDESKQSEVELKDINPSDFQNFLEVLHGELSVDESTIEGILKLADMFNAETAFRHCEKFLLNESTRGLKEKLIWAIQYKMEKLKNKCIPEIKTIDDISAVIPEDPTQIDADVWKKLLNISIDLYKKK